MDNTYNEVPIVEGKTKTESPYRQIKPEGYLKQKWFAFGCLTAVLLAIILTLITFSSIALLGRKKVFHTPANSYLHLRLTGVLEEHKELDQDIFSMTRSLSAREIIARINYAADDPNIRGIIIEPLFISGGYSTLNEILIALQNFKETGKHIAAYLELSSNRDYYLAAVADQIYLNPSASSGIFLSGVGFSSLYMKDLFDKLGIEWTILHSGEFKGAGEEFSRTDMSPQMKQSLTLLLDDMYSQLLTDIAAHRNLDIVQIRHIYEQRPDLFINQDYALNMNIVDVLATREVMLENLGIDEDQLMRIDKYNPRISTVKSSSKIAVVYLQGTITIPSSGFGQNYITANKMKNIIETIDKDPSIKAIVLRINSPGGSALESDKIYRQIQKLNSTIPIVVSMSDVAASGGYYIAAPGDFIFADPYTITGSIGVAAMIPNFYHTGQKIGVNPQSLYRGKFTNFMNIWERVDATDLTIMQRSLDATYNEFKNRVSDGRNMSMEDVEKVAQGRIWSSRRALDNKLIDAIGTLDRAIEKAAELADLDIYATIYLPETKTLWGLLLERRFDMNIMIDLISNNIFSEEKLEKMHQIYSAVKDDPIQMLSPIFFVE